MKHSTGTINYKHRIQTTPCDHHDTGTGSEGYTAYTSMAIYKGKPPPDLQIVTIPHALNFQIDSKC